MINTVSKNCSESTKLNTQNIPDNDSSKEEAIDLVDQKLVQLSINNNYSVIDMVSTYISDYLEADDFEVSKSSHSKQPIWRDAFDDLLSKIKAMNFNVPEFPVDLEKHALNSYLKDQVLPYIKANDKADFLPLFISNYHEKNQSLDNNNFSSNINNVNLENGNVDFVTNNKSLDFVDNQAGGQNILSNDGLGNDNVDSGIKFGQFSDISEKHKNDSDEGLNDSKNELANDLSSLKVDQVDPISSQDKSRMNKNVEFNKKNHHQNLVNDLKRSNSDLSDQLKLSRIHSTGIMYNSFLQEHPLSLDIHQFLNNCFLTMGDVTQFINVRYLNCEWLFGAINSLKKIMINDVQEYQNFNNHYFENLRYLREISFSYDGLFRNQVTYLTQIDQYILKLETLPNYSSLFFKVILNKSIFMLKNAIKNDY